MPMSQAFKERLSDALPDIARDFGTPVHVYDEVGIRETLEELEEKARRHKITGFKEFFAVKATPYSVILRMIKEVGFGFDCSSEIEVILAREAGAAPEDIMFTSNNTTSREFEVALGGDGCILNLDDVSFLQHSYFRNNPFPETICFRVNPGELRDDDSVIGVPLDAKYGIMVGEIIPAYRRAQEMGAKRFGMHTMIASNDLDYRNMVKTVKMLLRFARQLHDELGIKLDFINMGGGIGIPYKPEDEPFDLESMFREIRAEMDDYEGTLGPINLFMESGRYITGPHGVLVNRAINRKEIYGRMYVGVECAMPGLMRPAMYGSYHHISVYDSCGVPSGGPLIPVHVVGPICENCDRVTDPNGPPRPLPKILNGDFVVTEDAGAHGAAMGFNYNGRPRPGGVMINTDGSLSLVCHPETVDTLLARTRGL